MMRYAKIADDKTMLCEVGLGTNTAFYESIGMTMMDVEQGYDGQWYVTGHAPKQPLSELRTAALSRIDSSAQSDILSGFDYEINGEILHFSYLAEDQQNFSDTFNGIAMKKLMGVEGLPETIGWNGWRNPTSDSKGELVRLNLDIDSFLALYTKGALAHKSYHMAIHGQRKEAIESAESIEAINALLEEWRV
jgi:hypothetical protein